MDVKRVSPADRFAVIADESAPDTAQFPLQKRIIHAS